MITQNINDDKISVVVPIYNAENFLYECIESILSQENVNLELILVDDGSCDNSKNICLNFQYIDQRVRYFYKENSGVSDTRNYGLQNAYGNYVIFVDADDMLMPNALFTLLNYVLKYNLDFVRGECVKCDLLGKSIKYSIPDIRSRNQGRVLTNKDFLMNIFAGDFYSFLFLFRKEFLFKNGLKYPVGVTFCEDMLFLLSASLFAKRTMYVSDRIYRYRLNINSVSHKPSLKNLLDYIDSIKKASCIIDKFNETDISLYFHRFFSLQLLNVCSYASLFTYKEINLIMNRMRVLGLYKRSMEIFTLKSMLYEINPSLLIYILKLKCMIRSNLMIINKLGI